MKEIMKPKLQRRDYGLAPDTVRTNEEARYRILTAQEEARKADPERLRLFEVLKITGTDTAYLESIELSRRKIPS